MKRAMIRSLILGMVGAGAIVPVTADAQGIMAFAPALPGPWGMPGPLGVTGGGSPYSLGQVPTPPYFALHPPVYYSVPVARTYGYSPYAYPATVGTPAAVCEPAVIVNPHVGDAEEPQADPQSKPTRSLQRMRGPLMVENPYVNASRRSVVSKK